MTKFSEKVSIRQATVTDAKLISALGAVTFYEAYYELDEPEDLADYIAGAFAPDKIYDELENSNSAFFIVFLDGKAIGYAKMRENAKPDYVKSENPVELQRIYILQRHFGSGIGENLLRHCLDKAREKGFQALWLGVWEKNLRALRFYEKHGFRRVGRRAFPYGNAVGTDFVMEKIL